MNKTKEILEQVQNTNFLKELNKVAHTYFVGGCVRDMFISDDIKPKDVDILVCGIDIDTLIKTLSTFGKVNEVGKSFGCVKLRPNKGFEQLEDFDFVIARKEVKTGHGHKGFEITTDKSFTIYDDLKRRDFTINSIALDTVSLATIDPYNGIKDVSNGVISMVDKKAFKEDPLRIIRGYQFASRFGFVVDNETEKEMFGNVGLFGEYSNEKVSGDRFMIEIKKVFTKGQNYRSFITNIRPYLCELFDCDGLAHSENLPKEFDLEATFADFMIAIFKSLSVDLQTFKKVLNLDNETYKKMSFVLGTKEDIDFVVKGSNIKGLFDMFYVDSFMKFVHRNNKGVNPLNVKELKEMKGIHGGNIVCLDGESIGDALNREIKNGISI